MDFLAVGRDVAHRSRFSVFAWDDGIRPTKISLIMHHFINIQGEWEFAHAAHSNFIPKKAKIGKYENGFLHVSSNLPHLLQFVWKDIRIRRTEHMDSYSMKMIWKVPIFDVDRLRFWAAPIQSVTHGCQPMRMPCDWKDQGTGGGGSSDSGATDHWFLLNHPLIAQHFHLMIVFPHLCQHTDRFVQMALMTPTEGLMWSVRIRQIRIWVKAPSILRGKSLRTYRFAFEFAIFDLMCVVSEPHALGSTINETD